MLMKPLKTPLSYEDQITRLISEHALTIDDTQTATDILNRVNYYRLSAYGIGLKRSDDAEKYIPGITIQTLYDLYCFDSQLRSILIPVIEAIEIDLRTKIAYHLAMTYGADGYYDAANFQPKTDREGNSIHTMTMEKFKKEVIHQKNLPCVVHHMQVYGGRFPVWVAVELFTFGMLSSLYSIMNSEDQKAVAKQYGTDPYHLVSWFLSLVELRNLCAHYNRVYNMPLKQTAKLYREHQRYQCNRLFPILLVIKRMTSKTKHWNAFLSRLLELIKQYPVANLSFMGFPANWEQLLRE